MKTTIKILVVVLLLVAVNYDSFMDVWDTMHPMVDKIEIPFIKVIKKGIINLVLLVIIAYYLLRVAWRIAVK